MTKSSTLIPDTHIDILRKLRGSQLQSFGTAHPLGVSRTAIGEVFIETDKNKVVLITSHLRSYEINGVIDDFASISIRRGDRSIVESASTKGGRYLDFSDSVITNLGIIRVEFIRTTSGRPWPSCVIDLGIVMETAIGRIAIFNGSIWVNELDVDVFNDDVELGAFDGFASDVDDVWESRISVVKIV